MANTRLYPFWGSLTEALRTGRPQNEIKRGENLFEAVYKNPDLLRMDARGRLFPDPGRAPRQSGVDSRRDQMKQARDFRACGCKLCSGIAT